MHELTRLPPHGLDRSQGISVSRVAIKGFASRKARGQDPLPRSSLRAFKGWRVRGMHGGLRRCTTLRKDPRAAARTTSPVPFIPSAAAEAMLTQVAFTATVREPQRLECCSAETWEEIAFYVCSPFLLTFDVNLYLISFFCSTSTPVRRGF